MKSGIDFQIAFNFLWILNKMASIAIMIGGAIINATEFVGGSYLAKYLSRGSNAGEGRKRHDHHD